jgi:hypothetical protein
MSSIHSTLVSPRALRALFVEGKPFRSLSLRGLGLTDNHVLAIVDGLSTSGAHLSTLNLESNPGITARGYGALFNLINQTKVIGYTFVLPSNGKSRRFCLDDKAWEGELTLVSEMNSKYCRLEYLTNGTFTSEKCRWQWLERLVNLPMPDENYEEYEYIVYHEDDDDVCNCDEDKNKERDAKHLNFIWYTLRQNPEMMQVSQAPTRVKKRKAT